MNEADLIKERYKNRETTITESRYSYRNPSVYMAHQEKERALIRWLAHRNWPDVSNKKAIEVGCGTGGNLYSLMRLGFRPENLVGNELLAERYDAARHSLPPSITLLQGDACELNLKPETFDVVLQSTVFTSILNDSFQERLAAVMWQLVKPGGGILWYDFTFNNPNNPDVRGVSLRRIQELFPMGQVSARKITLAPPISRRVCNLHPALYHVFNACPLLRTHLLCWISKPDPSTQSPLNNLPIPHRPDN